MTHQSGFVNIIGKPNVGKSTLMNALVGERLSIITSKAQTTRHRILGIVNGENFQIVFSDTPGIIKPQYGMHKSMMKFVDESFKDADVLVLVLAMNDLPQSDDPYLQKLKRSKAPLIVVLNKIDLASATDVNSTAKWLMDDFKPDLVAPISALKKKNTKELFDEILGRLPEGPAYYPKDALTDKPEKFFVSEIIREKILVNYKQEIPYSTEVEVEEFKEEEDIIRIRAIIYVNRKSQKPILIGKEGRMLKRVGTDARKDMEVFLDKKVFLELFVKVKENWRDNDFLLKQFGYK
jgi:GTP-binding protein Era